jgi:acyl-coenzyme A synthetase/AMP-(fatty) acid ligase/acyl carrier protein
VLLSGDWIPIALPDRVRRIAPSAAVTSLGGATEGSIWSILYPIGDVSPAWKSIPYGRPMANQTMVVLDERLEERPDWVPGELYIGGAGVALGYWRDAELTSRKFITHPRTGQRLYRTGDWGRWLPDGNIELLGRIDAQVKIHGHRIECGEIEAALALHPRVRQCAVVAKRDPTNHPHLVAYVVFYADGEAAPSTQSLRAFLADKLPAYMVPAIVTALPSLPLTQNGKVDTRALPTPDAFDNAKTVSRPPENATEAAILEIVARELGREHIGIDDNFFEIGGDSIHALRILHAIGQRFETELSMVHLVEDPTIAGLALAVEEAILAELETREA